MLELKLIMFIGHIPHYTPSMSQQSIMSKQVSNKNPQN